MALFKTLTKPDRQATQLAYQVKHWPYAELSRAGRELLRTQRKVYLRKQAIIDACHVHDPNLLGWNGRDWKIVWAYNNVPTEQEWDKRGHDVLIACEFRTSPAIEGFAVVILSFELPSTRFVPHARGELV